jgi:hypothetical protein
LGYSAAIGPSDDDAFLEALDEGLRCAAANIGTFGTSGLRRLAGGGRDVA